MFYLKTNQYENHTEKLKRIISSEFGLELHDVQIQGGLELLNESIIEMETGEGKTLTAVLPVSILAQAGQGILVATANDYLAERDALWMKPVYETLGLSVGFVKSGLSFRDRKSAYQCDVTYGTLREFGFDYLKDRLSERTGSEKMQRDPYALLVDEADNLLIDEARLPLLISQKSDEPVQESIKSCYQWCARVAPEFNEGIDFIKTEPAGRIALTPLGKSRFYSLGAPDSMKSISLPEVLHRLEMAIHVNESMIRDREYIVQDRKVKIVDELTGRTSRGRVWGKGIHQAIEAKENLPVTSGTETVANITVNEFVNRFPKVSGMTGTAFESRKEFQFVYGLSVCRIPSHKKNVRKILPPKAFLTTKDKSLSVVEEIREMQNSGRPVLVGTRTVESSQQLSDILKQEGIDHQLLNARFPEREAEIVAQAGQPSRVTIATNMAGRGTDIVLDDSVRKAGGQHVINFELNASSRIDRQLEGRCARQGDPGTFRQYMSLEDEIVISSDNEERTSRIQNQFQKGSVSEQKLIKFLTRCQKKNESLQQMERQLLARSAHEMKENYQILGLDPVLDSLNEK